MAMKLHEVSTFFAIWIFALMGLNIFWPKLLNNPFSDVNTVFALGCLVIALIGTFHLIKWFYESSYNSSFKKLSLKNVEAEKDVNDTSVLNKNVEEILYFFEMTQYNLVIFEDIDRFDKPHIFVKLREMNTLLNNNETIKEKLHIQFLYALKDSVYSGCENGFWCHG